MDQPGKEAMCSLTTWGSPPPGATAAWGARSSACSRRSSGLGRDPGGVRGPGGGGQRTPLRRRRLGFYQRNGFRPLSYDCLLFGVHYRTFLLSPNGKGTEAAAMEAHRGVYRSQLAPWAYEKFVEIPRDPTRPAAPAASWADQTNLPGLGGGGGEKG